jgi:hypothetical protein
MSGDQRLDNQNSTVFLIHEHLNNNDCYNAAVVHVVKGQIRTLLKLCWKKKSKTV